MNVPVKEETTIGDDVIIGMGSVVLRNIDAGMVALGNPARPMKANDSKRVFLK
jgi:acetyltransferase-like isoleucine patch superfamily enzyme